jgi:hypothetical protein
MKMSKMEIGKNAENGKSTLLQYVVNCFRDLGQNIEKIWFRLG